MNSSLINSTSNPVDDQLLQISSVIVIVLQVVNFFIGIPLNICVIVLLTRAGGLDESVFLALSQSVLEIFFALSAPLYILCVVGFCYIIPMKFFSGIGMVARLMFQCLVCLERYLAVVHPITFLKFKPLKYRLFWLIVGWICMLTCSIAFMFVSPDVVLDFVGIYYSVIVIVELFCCVSILKVLRQPAPGKREDSGMSNTKKKAFRIVVVSLLTHLIQVLPLVITYSLKNTLSLAILHGATSLTLALNIAGGLMPPFFFSAQSWQINHCFCHLQK